MNDGHRALGKRWIVVLLLAGLAACSVRATPDWRRSGFDQQPPDALVRSAKGRIRLVGVLGSRRWQHPAPVTALAATLDGKRVVTGCSDGRLSLWNGDGGTEIARWKAHQGPVRSVALHPRGTMILSAGDGEISAWLLSGSTVTLRWRRRHAGATSVTLAPNGGVALATGADRSIGRWDATDGRTLDPWATDGEPCRVAIYAPDGAGVYCGAGDGSLHLRNAETGKVEATLRAPDTGDAITCLSVSDGGRFVVSGDAVGTVHVWDRAKGTLATSWPGSGKPIVSVAISADGTTIAIAGSGAALRVYRQGEGLRAVMPEAAEGASAIAVSADGAQLVAACGLRVRTWDLIANSERTAPGGHTDSISSLAPSGERLLVTGAWDRTLRVWDAERGTLVATWMGHNAPVECVASTRDGRLALSGGRDGTVNLWDVATNSRRAWSGHDKEVSCAALSPDGTLALTGSWDSTLRLWSVKDGGLLRTWRGHTDSIYALAMSPDGRRALSGGADGSVFLWDLASGTAISSWTAGVRHIDQLVYLKDGSRALIASSRLPTIALWNVDTQSLISEWPAGQEGVRGMAFGKDERALYSIGSNGSLKLWDLDARMELDCIEVDGSPTSVAVQGPRVFVGNRNSTVTVYTVDPSR